ncbi:MAG: TfoX/Sxy family protein [Azospirillaceae bacterium]
MAYDQGLAERLRTVLADLAQGEPIAEKRMFGGLAFMVGDHMCCGIVNEAQMLRLDKPTAQAALARPHVRPMDFTGRPMPTMVYVDPPGIEADEDLSGWVNVALGVVRSLPPKSKVRQ